jgi:hypothetical protein
MRRFKRERRQEEVNRIISKQGGGALAGRRGQM